MLRPTFCSLMVLAILAVGLARADDVKNKSDKDKNHAQATITKVDAKKGAVTVTMKDWDGKEVDKTFQLAAGAEYFDSDGKAAKIDAFQPGDEVLLTEEDGKIAELKKDVEHAQATITKVDAKKSAVTVTMKDQDGKEVDKTFQLAAKAEYFDSDGKAPRSMLSNRARRFFSLKRTARSRS